MDLGIFTICYNGYGEFAPRWCASIAQSTVTPTQVTLALFGGNHGLSGEIALECKKILPCLNIVHCGEHVNIGTDRNKAVEKTNTEWIMLLDADDALLPSGLEEIEKRANEDTDVIAVAYVEERLSGYVKTHLPPEVMTEEALFKWRDYWVSPYSPFRRCLWERTPYANTEFPNAPMVFSFVLNGARWASTSVPCARHIRRVGSHATASKRERTRRSGILDGYVRSALTAIQRSTDGG